MKMLVVVLSMCAVSLTAGCQSAQTRSGEGAVIGGVLGAAVGGIVGHQSGRGGEGAAIGAAAGALTGAVVGSSVPKSQQVANPNQISIQEIIDLSSQGVNENVIIDKIRLSNSRFALTAVDIAYLKEHGVSERVINVMQGK